LAVPVIAIFTKFDALDNKAFAALRKEKLSRADAKREAPGRATAEFERMHLDTLYAKPYPPKGHTHLRGMSMSWRYRISGLNNFLDMDKPGADCSELIEETAAALDDEVMQQLLVSTQRNNLELCIKYALERLAFYEVCFDWEANFRIHRILIPEVIRRIEQNLVLSPFADGVTEGQASRVAHLIFSWFPHFVVSGRR
jgi:hypothetical protein